jgi:hypothetical protein
MIRRAQHIIQNPSTLIARFFGFHRVAPHRDRKHYFVVMGNIFAQNLEVLPHHNRHLHPPVQGASSARAPLTHTHTQFTVMI